MRAWLLASLAAAAAAGGPHEVTHKNIKFDGATCALGGNDTSAGAELGKGKAVVYYPTDAGPGTKYPVLSFAHGVVSNFPGAYNGLLHGVATYGYIVVALLDCTIALQEYQEQMRTLNYMLTEDPLSTAIEKSRGTGVFGHSMGGASTINAASDAKGIAENNVAAAVAMHPGVQLGSLVPHVPILYTTGSIDPLCGPQITLPAYQLAKVSGVDRGYAVFKGCDHITCVMGPTPSKEAKWVAAWMDCYLKGDAAQCDMIYGAGDGSLCHNSEIVKKGAIDGCAAVRKSGPVPPAPVPPAPVPPAPVPPAPVPPASDRYHCDAASSTCTAAAAGHSTLAKCEAACGAGPAPPASACYQCVVPDVGCTPTRGTEGCYPTLAACAAACPVPTPATPPPDPPMPPVPPAPAPPAPGTAQGPGAGKWTVSTPEAHGLKSAGLKTADKYIGSHALVRDCLVVVKDGEIVYEAGNTNKAHQAWSMTKTLGALLVGVGIRDGQIDVDADITAAYGVKSPKGYGVTSAQIMAQALAGSRAGQKFKYDVLGTSWIDTLAKVVHKATGLTAGQTWRSHLAQYLGLEHFSWPDTNSLGFGSSGSCRDFARIGQLLLNKGAWKGGGVGAGVNATAVQLIPASYVDDLVKPHKWGAFDYSNPCYGYLTWLNADRSKFSSKCVSDAPGGLKKFPDGAPHDVFMAAGFTGEVTLVIPKHNAVVVSMGTTVGIQGFTGTQIGPIIYEGLCKGGVFGDPC